MTRGIVGILILLLLLGLGLFAQWTMASLQTPIAGELTQAAQAAAVEDWDGAVLHQQTARQSWEKRWRLTAALADHQPMEDVDSLFARLPVYAARQETAEFAACCYELARRVQAVSDAHSLTWWNLM